MLIPEAGAQMDMLQMTDRNVVKVSSGSYQTFVIDDEGKLWSWGGYDDARLGRDNTSSKPYNRAAQITASGMKRIKDVNASDQIGLALDTDGVVWTWGTAMGYLGRSGGTERQPGKVVFPAGTPAMVSVAASYHGGFSVDENGAIWAWGGLNSAYYYGMGDGQNSSAVSTPKKLKDSSSALGNNRVANGLANVKFIRVEASDYNDNNGNVGIALDDQGQVWTWGNNGDSARGGSYYPYKVKFNWNGNVKRIECGDSFYMVLTDKGYVYTWGAGGWYYNQLGMNDEDARSTPPLVKLFTQGTAVDASAYWHSLSVLDKNGYIYCSGYDTNTHHAADNWNGYRRSSVSGAMHAYKITMPSKAKGKALQISEGARSLAWFGAHGNLYVISDDNNYRGSTDGTQYSNEPWVHFVGDGSPHFTDISSSPTNREHNYAKPIAGSITIKVNNNPTSVQYVILQQGDADKTTYYDKTFYKIEEPYLLLDKDGNPWTDSTGRLLVSQFGEGNPYYAHPGITETLFQNAYNAHASSRGTLTNAGSGTWTASNVITSNCVLWVQIKNSTGSQRMIYNFENFYDQTQAWISGTAVASDGRTLHIFTDQPLPGGYGLPKNANGTWYTGVPPLGFDLLKPDTDTVKDFIPKDSDGNLLWKLKSDISETGDDDPDVGRAVTGANLGTLATTKHRTNPAMEIYINGAGKVGNTSTKTPKITFEFEKDPAYWLDVTLHYAVKDASGALTPITVFKVGESGPVTYSEDLTGFAPKGISHVLGREPYIPKKAVNGEDPIGFIRTGTSNVMPANISGVMVSCQFPNEFDPVITQNGEHIWIVYEGGLVNVKETYWVYGGGLVPDVPIQNSNGELENERSFDAVWGAYDAEVIYAATGGAPQITNYVAVGHLAEGGSYVAYPWDSAEQKYKVPAGQAAKFAAPITSSKFVKFMYKEDMNNNGIADDEEGMVTVRWYSTAGGVKSLLRNVWYSSDVRATLLRTSTRWVPRIPGIQTAGLNPVIWRSAEVRRPTRRCISRKARDRRP
jgi:alpha-tubulin suppressor-like RCC1 family protein